MLKVEHIGIAVNTLAESVPLFEKLLKSQCYKTEIVESEKVNTAFFKIRDTKIELLESIDENGVIAKFIEKKGVGVHHIAFVVDNIETVLEILEIDGFILLYDKPNIGAVNKLVCFLHPKSTNWVLIELCQEI